MSTRKGVLKGLGFIVGALALGIVAAPKNAEADLIRAPLIVLGTTIPLTCSNSGSHQDVAKTPILKNTSGATLHAGQTLSWKSSDGDKGSVKLAADLAPNATIQGIGNPGNAFTCTASFVTSADLTIKGAQFNAGWTSATVQVQNLDSWVDAPPSVVKVEVVQCGSGTVLATGNSVAVPVAKGQAMTVTVPFSSAVSGKKYLRVRADANKQVIERNEQNNLSDDFNSCIY